MTLYVDYSPLLSNAGSCAAAYAALRLAGHSVEVVYGFKALHSLGDRHGRDLAPPVLVTDTGKIITSLPDILAWLEAPGRRRGSGGPPWLGEGARTSGRIAMDPHIHQSTAAQRAAAPVGETRQRWHDLRASRDRRATRATRPHGVLKPLKPAGVG